MGVEEERCVILAKARYRTDYRIFIFRTLMAALAVLLLAGGAGAVTEINSCTTIDLPGVYELTTNIENSDALICINITSSDVVFDGRGYTIDGDIYTYGSNGIYANGTEGSNLVNVTVKNVTVTDWYYGIRYFNTHHGIIRNNNVSSNYHAGIYLSSSDNNNLTGNTASNNIFGISIVEYSNNNNLTGNTATNNLIGISIAYSNNNNLTGNILSNNNKYGIHFTYSSSDTLTGNIMTGNRYNFDLFGNSDAYLNHNIDLTNTVDGKPIYYVKNAVNQIYNESTNAGLFYCINCNNVTIKGLTLNKNTVGVFLWKTTNSSIENIYTSDNGYGI